MDSVRFRVSLRLRHPSVPESDISAHLAMSPDVSWNVGDERVSVKGTALGGIRSETYWTCVLAEAADQDLSDLLREKLGYLEKRKLFLKNFMATGGSLEFYVALFVKSNGGVVIDYKVLRRMASRHIALALDLYADGQAKST